MNSCLVSVIIPVYNAAGHIIETLESVFGQTCQAWELILVDDGSTDDSVELIRAFLDARSAKAKLLRHPDGANRGTSATRNLGLRHAAGDLVCFLDADDVWRPGFLDYFIRKMRDFPSVSMAYCPCIYWYPDPDDNQAHAPGSVQELGLESSGIVDELSLCALFLENENAVPSPSGVVLRRSTVNEIGGWEDRFRGMCDDQALYSKLLLGHNGVFVGDQPLYYYRQHAASLCRTAVNEDRFYDSKKTYLLWLKAYLQPGMDACGPIGQIVGEQLALLEIRKQIDLQFDGARPKYRAARNLVGIFAAMHHEQDIRLSYKVLRYSLGYFVAKLVGAG